MLSVRFEFPWGRFHANPSGSHPNDGEVEWPPSPWRLLRSLTAVALTRCFSSTKLSNVESVDLWAFPRNIAGLAPEDPLADLASLLSLLAATPPRIVLPPSGQSHIRTYQPKADQKTMLVHDAFRVVDGPVAFEWPELTLDPSLLRLLSRILREMPHFGRAESSCEASVSQDALPPSAGGAVASPTGTEEATGVRVLAAASGAADRLRTFLTESRSLRKRYDKRALAATLAEEGERELLLRALLRSTDDDRADGLLASPGSFYVTYNVTETGRRAAATPRLVTGRRAFEWALDTTNPNGEVLPLLTDAVHVADAFQRCALAMWGRRTGGAKNRTLSGHEDDGSPLRDHSHAFWSALDVDGDGRIERVRAWLRDGEFSSDELAALRAVTRVFRRGRGEDLFATSLEVEPPTRRAFATIFRSHTAYVPAAFHATHGRSGRGRPRTTADRLIRDLVRMGVIRDRRDIGVEPIGAPADWTGFQSQRERRSGAHGSAGGFRITFAEPRSAAPFAVGALAHRGLGLFLPERTFSALPATEIPRLLRSLSEELTNLRAGATELDLVGGAAMALAFGARAATEDVDVVVRSGEREVVMAAAAKVAARLGLPRGWLNDSSSRFVAHPADGAVVFEEGPLRVRAASDAQMLALKVSAFRGRGDMRDAELILRRMGLSDAETAWSLIGGFVPEARRDRVRYNLFDLFDALALRP